jgi:hypothetical protein
MNEDDNINLSKDSDSIIIYNNESKLVTPPEYIQVSCASIIGYLYTKKFGSGGKGRCIKVIETTNDNNEQNQTEKWLTPIEFEAYCGKGSCRHWQKSIKANGQYLYHLYDNDNPILIRHAICCSCAVCCDDDKLTGPIRLFHHARRRKKNEILAENAYKKFLTLYPPSLQNKMHNQQQNRNINSPFSPFNQNRIESQSFCTNEIEIILNNEKEQWSKLSQVINLIVFLYC